MPTGITAIIDENNATLNEYLRRVARSLLLETREKGADYRLPRKLVLSEDWFGFEWLKRSRTKLEELKSIAGDPERQEVLRMSERVERDPAGEKKRRRVRDRYLEMQTGVEGCEALNLEGFAGLRRLALEQLQAGTPGEPPAPLKDERPLDAWYAGQLARAGAEVERDLRMIREKEEVLRERNAWVAQLLEHFPLPDDDTLPEVVVVL